MHHFFYKKKERKKERRKERWEEKEITSKRKIEDIKTRKKERQKRRESKNVFICQGNQWLFYSPVPSTG
jgi:hypothetical protein